MNDIDLTENPSKGPPKRAATKPSPCDADTQFEHLNVIGSGPEEIGPRDSPPERAGVKRERRR